MSIEKVAITKIRPNPYQPASRVNVSEETMEQFGKSILEHGLLQVPLARRTDGPNIYEMGDGWLRLKGQEWLVLHGHPEYQEIPLDVRELTDQQMADLVMEANTIRQDLTPIEEATFFKRYLEEFKVTQVQLAKLHNISQGEVANKVRLLELPDDIQKRIISREIPPTHARYLLPLKDYKPELNDVVKQCIEQNQSVQELNRIVNRALWDKSKPLFHSQYSYQYGCSFNLKECEGCPDRVILTEQRFYGEKPDKTPRCMNSACWDKKEEAARKQREKTALKKVAGLGVTKVYNTREVEYEQSTSLTEYDLKRLQDPEDCATCPKRAGYRDYGGDIKIICDDLKCHRGKVMKKSRERNKKEREDKIKEEARLNKAFSRVDPENKQTLLGMLRIIWDHTQYEGKERFMLATGVITAENMEKRGNINTVLSFFEKKAPEVIKKALVRLAFELYRTYYWSGSSELKKMENCLLAKEEAKEEPVKDTREALPASAQEPITALDRQLEKESIEAEKKAE